MEDLLSFLRTIECETLYLVSDTVDCWRLKKSWYWPESHQAVIREFRRRADAGIEVIFVHGNHDESAREFDGLEMAGIKVRTETTHVAADQRRFLVVHGDGQLEILRGGSLSRLVSPTVKLAQAARAAVQPSPRGRRGPER